MPPPQPPPPPTGDSRPQIPQYGGPPAGYVPVDQMLPPPAQGLAITSMVLGILGVFTFWLYGVIPILAIIFGAVAMSKAKKAGRKPSGMAITGLTLGIIFTALCALVVVVVIARNN